MKGIGAKILSGLFACCMIVALLAPAVCASPKSISAKHYNVMLVIDGSGSLTMQNGTDVEGYRFDATEMFLGLLTNSGNNVGAIVFDHRNPPPLDADIQPISGTNAKKLLINQIRGTKAGGDTDIGGALLSAVERLKGAQYENGLPSVVILMSDGKTDLPLGTPDDLKASLNNEEKAVREAVDNGIKVYSVLLNSNNSVSTGELESISTNTGGVYEEVQTSADLVKVYRNFYSIIYNADSTDEEKTFDDNGNAHLEIPVPGIGVEELNVVIQSSCDIKSITVTKPNGSQVDSETLKNDTIQTDTFRLLKLVDPEEGIWKVDVTGVPGEKIVYNLVFNSNITADAVIDAPKDSYESGDVINITTSLFSKEQKITDKSLFQKGYGKIRLLKNEDESTAQEFDMDVKGDAYKCKVTLPTVDEPATYSLYAYIDIPNLPAKSNTLLVELNPKTTNNLPSSVSNPVKVKIQDSGDGYTYFDLNSYFSDEDGDALRFEISDSPYSKELLNIDADGKTLKAKVRGFTAGEATLRAIDEKNGVCSTVFEFDANHAPTPKSDPINQIVRRKMFGNKVNSLNLSKWFADEEDDTLTFEIVACDYDYVEKGVVSLEENQQLSINMLDFKSSNMVIKATDEEGASCQATIHFKVLDDKVLAGGSLLSIILGVLAVLAISTWLIKRRKFRGAIQVSTINKHDHKSKAFGDRQGVFDKRQTYDDSTEVFGGPFRGMKNLRTLDISYGNLSGKSKFIVIDSTTVRFKSDQDFYCDMREEPIKSLNMSMGRSYDIYDSEERTSGITVLLTEKQGDQSSEASFGKSRFDRDDWA